MKNIINSIFLITALAMFFVWTVPIFDDISKTQAEINDFNDILDSSRELADLRNTVLAKYNSITNDEFIKFSNILPEGQSVNDYVAQLSSIASQRGVVIKKLDFVEEAPDRLLFSSEEIDNRNYRVLTFSSILIAPYRGFVSFLSDLEKSLRITDIDEIEFATNPENFYEIKVKGKIYFKK